MSNTPQHAAARPHQAPTLRRDLGTLQNYATLMGTMIGSGIFVVTGASADIAGPGVVIAYALLGPILLSTALAYSVYCSTPLGDRPGGAYLHITRTHGFYFVGYITGWMKAVAYMGSLAVLSLSTAEYMTFFLPDIDPTPVSIGVLLFFYVVNMLGVRHYGRVQLVMFAVLVAAVLVLVVPGLFAIEPDNLKPFLPFGWPGVVAAMTPLFYSYQGFESLAQTAGESRQARRRLPKMFAVGVCGALVIYVAMSFVAVGAVPFGELADADAGMALAAGKYLPYIGAAVVALGAIMAFLTSLNACLMVPSRLLYALGEDRVLPNFLSHVNRRLHTPDVTLTIATAVGVVLLSTRTLDYMVNVVVVGFLSLYALHSLTFVLLPFMRPALLRSAWFRPPTWLIVLTGLFSTACLAYLMSTALPSVVTLYAVWLGVGTLLYAFARVKGARDGFDYRSRLTDWENGGHRDHSAD